MFSCRCQDCIAAYSDYEAFMLHVIYFALLFNLSDACGSILCEQLAFHRLHAIYLGTAGEPRRVQAGKI